MTASGETETVSASVVFAFSAVGVCWFAQADNTEATIAIKMIE
jgi:hypothetical protein